MNMNTYLLGIDLGTSACKAALFTPDGKVIQQANAAYPVYYPQPGWAEQDPIEWWQGVCQAVRQVMEQSGISPAEIAAIGVDGQSWSAVAVDGKGEVLCNTPIWMDRRSQPQCQWIETHTGVDRAFEISGNPLNPAYTLPKILWYQNERPEVYQKIDKVLQSNAYIVYRLTGACSQDKSQGYGLCCYDMHRDRWDEDFIKDLGIRRDILPDICDCHQVVGRTTLEAAAQMGLCAGIPVVAGGLDAACGTLGAGVYRNGQTQEQGGQAGGMSICMDRYVADPRLILSRHVVPDLWILQGGTVGGGGALKWLSQQICAEEAQMARETGATIFEVMSDEAQTIAPGSDGLIFLPYMAGERSPIWDIHAKGLFFGLDYSKTRAHMIRACMEGVAYSLRHNLEIAAQAGAPVSQMYAMGGAANSQVWTQIKADITSCTIHVPASDTASTLGAAILAGVGVGIYPDFETAVQQTVTLRRTHLCNDDHRSVYDRGYRRYRKLYPQLKALMQDED